VRPSSAARFLARCRRLSSILMVVLMHQNISLMHQYVKPHFKPVLMENWHGKYQCANSNRRLTISLSLIVLLFFGLLPVTSVDDNPRNYTTGQADALTSADPQSWPQYVPGFARLDQSWAARFSSSRWF
jgi:hypothetical protein